MTDTHLASEAEPTEPGRARDPARAEPTEPTEPTEPGRARDPARVEPAEPGRARDPARAEPAEPTEPTEPGRARDAAPAVPGRDQAQPRLAGDPEPAAAGRPAPASAADAARAWRAVSEAVGVAVVEADRPLRLLMVALLAEGHALIEDVPGVGKTLLARAFARALGLDFGRIQGTPDLLPGDVTGASILDGGAGGLAGTAALRFVPGPVFTNVLLVDEINRATPRTQSALLEAMQEHQVSVEGVTRALPDPFVVLATQNPIEYEGTFSLPEAQLDRFLVRIRIGYPNVAAERRIARRHEAAVEPLDAVPTVLGRGAIAGLREGARRVHVADELADHLVAIVAATRARPEIELGASPRASVALFRASQASAYLDGRDFVLPDDVITLAPAVLAHRLRIDLDSALHGATAERVLDDVIAGVPVPVGERHDRGDDGRDRTG